MAAKKTQTFSVNIEVIGNCAFDFIDPEEIKEKLEYALYEQSKKRDLSYSVRVSENHMHREQGLD